MRISKPKLSALLGLSFLQAGVAGGDMVVLEPVKDTTLYDCAGGICSNGAGNHFFVGRTGEGVAVRGLLEFDLVGRVPVGSTVLGASLSLRMSRTQNAQLTQAVRLHRVLEEWGEAGSDAPDGEGGGTTALPGDATWTFTFFLDSMWATPGGDFDPAASASTDVTGIGFYSWTSPQLAADVQLFLDRARPRSTVSSRNHGWIVIGNEAAAAKRFDTRENSPGNRPKLTIEFEPPWVPSLTPAGVALLSATLAGTASVGLRRTRSQTST